jgi:hypothetical protein
MDGNPASLRGEHLLADNGLIHDAMLGVFQDVFSGRYVHSLPQLPR